jgi:hypothetical protein
MDAKPEITISLYPSETDFRRWNDAAVKMGLRRPPVFFRTKIKKTKTGFIEIKVANTKNMAKFARNTIEYYIQHEAERLLEKAKLAQEEKELLERKKKLGIL